jgi:hypothetical protein
VNSLSPRLVQKIPVRSIADGLGYVWGEAHKWRQIGGAMQLNEGDVRTELKLIIDRRNKIVHEADTDISSGQKYPISKADCERARMFLSTLGQKIVDLVV